MGGSLCYGCENLKTLKGGEKHINQFIRADQDLGVTRNQALILSDILNGYYSYEVLKGTWLNEFYAELRGLEGYDLESKCMELAKDKLGYEIIPMELKDILLTDFKPIVKID